MDLFKNVLMIFILITNLYGLGDEIKSFQADFTQNVEGENEGKISYSGKIEAKVPDFAKWTYLKPLKKEIFINGQNVIIYDPNLYQATISHLKEKTDFLSILKNATLQKDGNYSSKIGKTYYYLTFKDSKPYTLEFEDEFDNKVRIEFSNVIINSNISDKEFVFVPNDGIDIIHQ